MTPERLSRRRKFPPVPSHDYIFVYIIPPQNFMPARVTPAWVHPGCCTGARISWNLATVSCKRKSTTRFGVKSVCRLTVTGCAFVMFAILNHTCILSACSVQSYLQITRYEMTLSSCKRDTKVILVWNARCCEFSHVNAPLKRNWLQKLISICFRIM